MLDGIFPRLIVRVRVESNRRFALKLPKAAEGHFILGMDIAGAHAHLGVERQHILFAADILDRDADVGGLMSVQN